MRKFAEIRSDFEIAQRAIAQIPWRTNIYLMDKVKNSEKRNSGIPNFKYERLE